MRRFDEAYRLTDASRGTAETFNAINRDIDERVHSLEEVGTGIEARVETIISGARDRIDDALLPAFEKVQLYQSGGFLTAPIADETAVVFVEGDGTLAVHPDNKALFRPSPFTFFVRASTPDDWAIAQTVSYDDETGVYVYEIVAVSGDEGPHEDVSIWASAGSAIAQMQFLEAAEEARDASIDARNLAHDWAEKADGVDVVGAGTRSAKHYAGVAGAQAGAASGSAGAAAASAVVAGTKATESDESADLAQKWASENEDVVVSGGLYSAKHHAAKAAASAIAAALFDPSSYYDKSEIDGFLAGLPSSASVAALTARLSYVELMSLYASGGTVDVFADGFHSIAGTAVVDAAATSDANIVTSSSEGLNSTLPTLANSPASNSSPAGYTYTMSPVPTVAGDEYKAIAYTSGNVSTAANTAFTFEVTPPTSRVVDKWWGTATLGASRNFTLFFEGFTGGSWVTLDSINFTAATSGAVADNPDRAISPQTNALYSKFRWRVVITSGGATILTWDNLGCGTYIKPIVQSSAFTATSVPATIRLDVDAQFLVGGALQASDLVAEVSRDGGTTWIAVPLTLYPSASNGFGTLKYPCYGTVTMTGPSGTSVKWRISQAARLAPTTKRLQINSVMLRWT